LLQALENLRSHRVIYLIYFGLQSFLTIAKIKQTADGKRVQQAFLPQRVFSSLCIVFETINLLMVNHPMAAFDFVLAEIFIFR
jgi:hypothetical protein